MYARSAIVALFLSCPSPPLAASPQTYEFDPVHSQLVFFVEHLGFSHAIGRFNGWRGEFRFDPDDWSSASVDVRIPVETLDLGDADWNRKLLSDNWFDLKQHPQMRFVGAGLTRIDDSNAKLDGSLTLLGQTHPVSLSVHLNKIGTNRLTLKPTVGFTATATLSRAAFGMDESAGSVGDEVEIRIEVEGRRKDTRPRATGKR